MLNKKQILYLLAYYELDKFKDQFIIISGAAMTLRGLKDETHDIDITVSEKLLNYLLVNYPNRITIEKYDKKTGDYIYYLDKYINFSRNYRTKTEYTTEILLNNYNIQYPRSILELKENLNRTKDLNDIKVLKKHV